MNSLNINYNKIPIFQLREDQKRGYIDYIDIKNIDYPIMKGIDYFGRHYFIIKFFIDDTILMQTFFQRYKTDPNNYMGCGTSSPMPKLLNTYGGMNQNQLELLETIINNKPVKIEKHHNPIYNKFIGKNIYLYDKKKFDAIKIIQDNFRKYRYNPKYKFCSIVQHNNYLDIVNQYQ
jgi:hypothetical protein